LWKNIGHEDMHHPVILSEETFRSNRKYPAIERGLICLVKLLNRMLGRHLKCL
jgi:hypothetical protein